MYLSKSATLILIMVLKNIIYKFETQNWEQYFKCFKGMMGENKGGKIYDVSKDKDHFECPLPQLTHTHTHIVRPFIWLRQDQGGPEIADWYICIIFT